MSDALLVGSGQRAAVDEHHKIHIAGVKFDGADETSAEPQADDQSFITYGLAEPILERSPHLKVVEEALPTVATRRGRLEDFRLNERRLDLIKVE
nr:hypothetical protein [Micromonospora qiuiae]